MGGKYNQINIYLFFNLHGHHRLVCINVVGCCHLRVHNKHLSTLSGVREGRDSLFWPERSRTNQTHYDEYLTVLASVFMIIITNHTNGCPGKKRLYLLCPAFKKLIKLFWRQCSRYNLQAHQRVSRKEETVCYGVEFKNLSCCFGVSVHEINQAHQWVSRKELRDCMFRPQRSRIYQTVRRVSVRDIACKHTDGYPG